MSEHITDEIGRQGYNLYGICSKCKKSGLLNFIGYGTWLCEQCQTDKETCPQCNDGELQFYYVDGLSELYMCNLCDYDNYIEGDISPDKDL